ncbi:MAG: D-alanine--D-alanine ligase [Deltaproteobacteria bacterium]|nr:D-alanine--D-alanine ligase [Deltaproteobacteria bacterium]
MERPERIAILYNVDFDATTVDAAAVEPCARAIATSLEKSGRTVSLWRVHGDDILDVLTPLRASNPDLVFNLCESLANDVRNEPTLAGLLDLYKLPYTGADLVALASCLHKRRTKEVLVARGVTTPGYRYFEDPRELDDVSLGALDFPWFLKLAHEDASVGITDENHVTSVEALRARARRMIAEYAQPVLAERYIAGREINVTLVGNGADLRMLPPHEIDFGAMPSERPHIVSYAAKWDETHVDYAGTKPVPLRDATPELLASIESIARAAWDALGLRDYGRVDLRVDANGAPWVIDINPNCDISPDAGAARAAAAAGLSYDDLIDLLATSAWRRYR